jgi:hypothetical protein
MDVSLTPTALTGPVRANRYICLALLCPLLAQERPFGGLPNWSRSAMKRREQVQHGCKYASRKRINQSRPCAKISTSLIVAPRSAAYRVELHWRTRRRSRPHGAHRGGLGKVNSAGRDLAKYNLERKRTSSTSSAGLPKRRAVDTYPCDALWLDPSWPCMSSDRYTQSTLNVARHAKKSEVEGEIESQIEYQEV